MEYWEINIKVQLSKFLLYVALPLQFMDKHPTLQLCISKKDLCLPLFLILQQTTQIVRFSLIKLLQAYQIAQIQLNF